MYNPKLALDPKFGTTEMMMRATREGFGDVIVNLGQDMKNLVVLSADLTESTMCDKFATQFPDRFIEVGVAEQNLIAIASGMAVSGKVVFASSYAVFSPGKNFETVRTTIAYNHTNVKIMGHHTGLVTGPDGATHQALEDIALMSVLPGMRVIVPCDANQAAKAVKYSAQMEGPCYVRFSREKTPQITTPSTPFSSVPTVFWEGSKVKICIFCTGHMTTQTLLAVHQHPDLAQYLRVVDVAVLRPLAADLILEYSKDTKHVICCEDHQKYGGMGSQISQILSENSPKQMSFIAVNNEWGQSGSATDLLKNYGLDSESIAHKIDSLLQNLN